MSAVTIPVPPLHGPDRLAWLNALDEAVAVAVLEAGDVLLAEGLWSAGDIAPVLGDFAGYLGGRLNEAVALAVDVWEATR